MTFRVLYQSNRHLLMMMKQHSKVPVLTYSDNDYNLELKLSKESESKFDNMLSEQWKAAELNNQIRYPIKNQKWKLLDDKYKLLMQLNTERATNRRKPQEIMSMSQEFDSSRFNFTKISEKEILFDIGNGDGNDVIAVNVSPITTCHSLLLTQRLEGLPQKINLYSFKKAVEILLLSNSENFRVLFNSLCANASVNHLHWHLYYLNHRMLLETITLKSFAGPVYLIEDFPAQGYCVKLSSIENRDIRKFVNYGYLVANFLQESEIAYNIYITRAKTSEKLIDFDDIRIYIWARNSSFGAKQTVHFSLAACELFGHLPIYTEEGFNNLTTDYIIEFIRNTTSEVFQSCKEKIKKLVESNK